MLRVLPAVVSGMVFAGFFEENCDVDSVGSASVFPCLKGHSVPGDCIYHGCC